MTTETLSASIVGAIVNPSNPKHFMVINPVKQRLRIYAGDTLLVDTKNASRVIEVGHTIYDPAIYVPKDDIRVALEPIDKSTHCPLKGDASYHGLNGEEIGWSYDAPLPFASDIKGLHSFWGSKVRFVEGE